MRATEIVEAWRSAGRIDEARLQLWIDYGYMVAYGLLVSIGCFWARDRLRGLGRAKASRVAHALGWGVLAAVVFDATENVLLFAVLRDPSSSAIGFATAAATAKFALLMAAIGFVATTGAAALVARLGSRPSGTA